MIDAGLVGTGAGQSPCHQQALPRRWQIPPVACFLNLGDGFVFFKVSGLCKVGMLDLYRRSIPF